jgi:hypothetical protein
MEKKKLDPLIPLDDLKRVVRGLVAVPKAKIVKPKAKPKRKRRPT